MAKIIKVLNHNALIVHDAQSSRAPPLLAKDWLHWRINEQLRSARRRAAACMSCSRRRARERRGTV